MPAVSPPDVHALLPPLFACLPTAFASSRPPPALLPLLSPILRQRLHLLATSGAEQNWLTLLTWRSQYSQRLVTVASELQLEAHPVSGELELFAEDPDAARAEYKRLDRETLQARCEIRQHGLVVVWAWCTNDNGGTGLEALMAAENSTDAAQAEDGWRVAEVLPLEDENGNPVAADGWNATLEDADANFTDPELLATPGANGTARTPSLSLPGGSVGDDDDDDYWSRYDTTPGPTSTKPSPGPSANVSEMDYYAQYSSVQPAMDGHDPDEEELARDAQSTLHEPAPRSFGQPIVTGRSMQSANVAAAAENHDQDRRLHSPSPTRPSSSGSSVVQQLERRVSEDSPSSPAEAGVKQHIGYEVKSLYRLARNTGISRAEFERLVKLELDTLSMMDEDD